ncbi:MAG: glycerophosphodiester phosphodiesterase family protein [Armatimonadota bacterium]
MRTLALWVICITAAACAGQAHATETTAAAKSKNVLLIAHRGEAKIAPENTQAAFHQAWNTGVKAVELDVRLTKDNKIICSHDANTKRTSGVDLVVKDTDSAALRKLDVGSFKSEKYKGEKMPFLEEVIATLPRDCTILCEVKSGVEILPYLRDVLEKNDKRYQVAVICFNLDVCAGAKKLMPRRQVYYLKQAPKDPDTGAFLPYDEELVIKECLDNKLDGMDLKYSVINKAFVDKAASVGLKMFVYTCDQVADAQRVIDFGVVGITTNKAAWLTEQLAK